MKKAMMLVAGLCLATAFGCGDDGDGDGGGAAAPGTRDSSGQCVPESSTCSADEQNDYSSCITTMCDTEYKACLGDGYKSGQFDGVCKAYMECTTKCDCNDQTCAQNCGMPPSDCLNCLVTAGQCANSKCPVPACYTGGGGGGTNGSVDLGDAGIDLSKTCKDLEGCCAKIADATQKQNCTTVVNQGNDQACGASYLIFGQAGMCN